MEIIQITKSQLPIVAKLAHEIWPSAYGEILSKEQLTYMLDKFYSLEALSQQLEEKNHVFLLAEENGEFIGFASYELNIENHKTKIHKIYVLPTTQGKGYGVQLINEIENRSKAIKNDVLFLNVNRFNKAQYFYKKLGFEVVYEEDIEIGNGYLMEDFVMEKKI
ncbi:GNAT family N-acetyltransferase [uncultured Flavobacterium sp.]|uniref:GNAT family N-acetyltransferase n=1 Tax=uncultured Flavobacterium sp. TaxID=165435 RepID=UPI0030EF5B33|tara:strand:- start:175757 stop:176248 length:492 start_codon:yes stop_codon:yes gene_type:complete